MRRFGRNPQNLNQETLIKRTPKISSLTFRVILYQTRPSNSTGLTLMKTDLSRSTRMRYSNFIGKRWLLSTKLMTKKMKKVMRPKVLHSV